MAMSNYPSSSKRPFSDVAVEVVGGNKKKRNLYQVFISHRGPETKHSLAHHMYDVLHLKGFEVFFDIEEMEVGDEIPDQIWEAISTSAVQIAIISPGFGESVWCLKELVMIMQKQRDGSSLVIPVFYEVEPADLRFYKDGVPFCDRFHNKHRGRQSHETMDEWKKALKELADLSGFRWDVYQGINKLNGVSEDDRSILSFDIKTNWDVRIEVGKAEGGIPEEDILILKVIKWKKNLLHILMMRIMRMK